MPSQAFQLTPHIRQYLSASAFGIGIAVALILISAVAVHKSERRTVLRAPIILLALNVLLVLVRLPLSDESDIAKGLEIAAHFFLLLSLGRTLFVLIVDVFIGARLSRPLSRIIRDILQGFVYTGVGVIVLRQMGVEPSSLLTTSALLTAVIGLSLQETLGNLFAGLAIQAQRPFEVGDWIAVDEASANVGRVIEINWRATTVLTAEQVELIIPNGVLAKTSIRNFTKPTKLTRRVVEVEAPYDVSPAKVEEALLSASRGVLGVLATPAPAVLMKGFGESGILYHLHFWIDDFSLRDRTESAVRQRVWSSFQRAGIVIPFPIRTVYMEAVTAESQAEAQKRAIALRKTAIEGVDFLVAIPEDLRRQLAVLSRTCHFMPGEVVIRQGEQGSEFYIVQKGEVAVLVGLGADNNNAEVARLGPGKFFGEMSLVTGESRTATVQATMDTELVEVGKEAFHALLVQDPGLAESITAVLIERQIAIDNNLLQRNSQNDDDADLKSMALLSKIRNFFAL
jgi:small-conductance mechanosensitive channel